MNNFSFEQHVSDHIQTVKNTFISQESEIQEIINVCINAIQTNKKILVCGNGGSASDAQHLAAELVGRFRITRPAIPCIALTTDTSILTAISNDFGYEQLFVRQIEALANASDVLIGLSTSGKSANVINAFKAAKSKGVVTVGFCGETTREFENVCDFLIRVESNNTARIQEVHIMVIHILCDAIELNCYGSQ